MKYLIRFSLPLIILLNCAMLCVAQENKSPTGQLSSAAEYNPDSTEQAANKSATTKSTGVKSEEGEVDKFLKQNNGKDVVIGQCLEASRCASIKGVMVDGQAIKGDITAGKIINKPQPRYPPIARAAHQQGVVLVAVIVDEEGKVIAAQVQSGAPLLRVAALDAARAMLFTPTRLDGKPVKVAGIITYNFALI